MKLPRLLFYLLLIALPIQLGRHFFFPFSLIEGVRVDYLAPTIYLSDIIIFLMIGIWMVENFKFSRRLRDPAAAGQISNFKFPILVFSYLLFTSIFIASNQWVSLYQTVKIVEMSLLGYIIVRIQPRFASIVFCLSIASFYSSLLAIAQFFLQRSVGGALWFLGERTFSVGTPGIAAVSVDGHLLLRSYATFPHPNVLGGFLAIVLPLLAWSVIAHRQRMSRGAKTWHVVSFCIGIGALIATFSHVGWVLAALGCLVMYTPFQKMLRFVTHRVGVLYVLLIFLIITILPFLVFQYPSKSYVERSLLIVNAFRIISHSPLFGVGLLNSVGRLDTSFSIDSLFGRFQPVHNIYLLVFVETGIVGFLLMVWGIQRILHESLKKNLRVFIACAQLFLAGCVDHYLLTTQQGMLLLTVVASLAFLPKNTYDKEIEMSKLKVQN